MSKTIDELEKEIILLKEAIEKRNVDLDNTITNFKKDILNNNASFYDEYTKSFKELKESFKSPSKENQQDDNNINSKNNNYDF